MSAPEICEYCGKDCGNAGAATQHEDACDFNPSNQGQQTQAPARRQAGDQQAQPPDRQGRDAPQTAGGALADGVITAVDDDASVGERVGAIQSLMGVVGDGVERYQQYRESRMEEQRQRAANVELERIPDYPDCTECGRQLGPEDIGSDDEIVCPECGAHYRVIEPADGQDEPIDA